MKLLMASPEGVFTIDLEGKVEKKRSLNYSLIDLKKFEKKSLTFDILASLGMKPEIIQDIRFTPLDGTVYLTNLALNIEKFREDKIKEYNIVHAIGNIDPVQARITNIRSFKSYKLVDTNDDGFVDLQFTILGWKHPSTLFYLFDKPDNNLQSLFAQDVESGNVQIAAEFGFNQLLQRSVSPDGKQSAYLKGFQLTIANLDGSNETKIVDINTLFSL